eukprot:gnl/MRDRNA2_/MRDRNA2_96267_c0_seq1.p1 gnl/MRDRNA2_/MRDRNA2_96267_c0~~gnl/MRDRNA2_/MRDRNA2_96267_c0_seq1.p1  ORF type:complete len:599 (-),score=64.85 gnl/MRDRNA2_/MRDRNA2_96267_c0_seq1:280-2076(-)
MILQEIPDSVEVIPGRLYWVAIDGKLSGSCHARLLGSNAEKLCTGTTSNFSVDDELVYEPFRKDFGPLNLSMTYRYCRLLDATLKDPIRADKIILHYCSKDPEKQANAAFLIGAYRVVVQGKSAEEAYAPFQRMDRTFLPFRDASCDLQCDFPLTVLDCLCGLEKSVKLGWFNWQTFDIHRYDFDERVENGYMNWIVPEKFLAFASPHSKTTASEDAQHQETPPFRMHSQLTGDSGYLIPDHSQTKDDGGYPGMTPEDYVPRLREKGITLVVRLNRKLYDRHRFIENGIRHLDLFFQAPGCPSPHIIKTFLHVTECEPAPVGVHCLSGLCCTPILIGLYAMKHYVFPAKPFIAWCKICRPGCFQGRASQQFLCEMQNKMFTTSWIIPGLRWGWVAGSCELYTFVQQCTLGVKINWLKKPPQIQQVKAGSVAAKQGMLEGDVLIEVNGLAVTGSNWNEKDMLMKVIKESRPLHLKVQHRPVSVRRETSQHRPRASARPPIEVEDRGLQEGWWCWNLASWHRRHTPRPRLPTNAETMTSQPRPRFYTNDFSGAMISQQRQRFLSDDSSETETTQDRRGITVGAMAAEFATTVLQWLPAWM